MSLNNDILKIFFKYLVRKQRKGKSSQSKPKRQLRPVYNQISTKVRFADLLFSMRTRDQKKQRLWESEDENGF